MNAREKEQYLREYHMMKMRGKPFFPYAVLKDSLMACIVLAVIIAMAILFGSELGPKADPTSTTYTPRPEWYFFFLFELLRVVKPPALVFITTIAAMAYLTVEGALAGSPTEIEMGVAKSLEPGKAVAASSGCLGCHKIGENGNSGPGPALTKIGARLPRQAIARTLINPTPPMPTYSKLRQQNPKEFDQLVTFLSSLK